MSLSPRGRSLIDAARAASPTEADRARVRRALAMRLGAVGVATFAGARPTPSFFGAKGPYLASIALCLGLGAAAGAAWQGARERPVTARAFSVPPLLVTITQAPPTVAETEPPSSPSLALGVAAPGRPKVHPGPPPAPESSLPVAAAPTPTAPLRDELSLLEQAYRALAQGESKQALSLVADLEARHPEGALVEERLAVRALALCAEGRVDDARATRRTLAERAPASMQLGRLQASCAGENGP